MSNGALLLAFVLWASKYYCNFIKYDLFYSSMDIYHRIFASRNDSQTYLRQFVVMEGSKVSCVVAPIFIFITTTKKKEEKKNSDNTKTD